MDTNRVRNRQNGPKGTKFEHLPSSSSVTKNFFCAIGNLVGIQSCAQNADVTPNLFENGTIKCRPDEKLKQGAPKNREKNAVCRTPLEQQPTVADAASKKSILLAYILWLFGGVFGLHLFYLDRDAHAFLTWSTLGGYGLGWLADITKIPRYVRECNNDPRFLHEMADKMRCNKKPPFSSSRFISAVMVGYLWGQLVLLAIPQDEVWGVNWNTYFHWLIPLAVALGVWVVGNIGKEQGKPWLAIVVSYISYISRWYIYDESIWLSLVMFSAAIAFDTFSKEWRRSPKKKSPLWKRVIVVVCCVFLYIGLWSSYIYFNGKITDSNGEEIPVHEAIHHFFTSSWWTDFKQSLYDIYLYAQHHGWYEIWKQVIDLSDPQGEQNAYKVLGVSPTASQQEITARWRALSRENHPDKVKVPQRQREAQERFMEIQQAYEILSNIKNKRGRKNKKSIQDEF